MKGKVDLKQLSVAFKKYKYVALVLCVGVLLMLFPSGGKETLQTSDANKNETVFDLEELESKLANALSQINGVGEATVVLTLRTGGEEILAQDVSKGTSVEMQTVIVSTGGNGEAPVRIKTMGWSWFCRSMPNLLSRTMTLRHSAKESSGPSL